MESISLYIKNNSLLLLNTLRELCAIPAPSHNEAKRAEYCRNWLKNAGLSDVYVDKALNVICPINCNTSQNITVVAAHTDTVFPDIEPMPITEDENNIFCPGVGDNTASLAVLLLTAKYINDNKIMPKDGLLLVCNSCEEGLGNLKGIKQIFNDYQGRIKQFISLDSNLDKIANRCVGSDRYEITVTTEGGHSYLAFGNSNAIAQLAKIVNEIYQITIPEKANTKTTYNVGMIQGGTSVNTIPQSASMMCEYRSDDQETLEFMKNSFISIFNNAKDSGVNIEYKLLGSRPCMGNMDIESVDALGRQCADIIKNVTGEEPRFISSSTDCNIPLSLGIPAVCIGVFYGGGMHTREEWVNKSSLPIGLEVSIKTLLKLI